MNKRKYIVDEKNKTFTKYYFNLEDKSKIYLEFKKGKILSKIVNYPKPISFNDQSITYEYLDIKYSLYNLLIRNKLKIKHLKKIGKYLRKMHNQNIMHGDFTPVNIVFTENDKIFFIDASFSEYNNENQVLLEVDDIYRDISLMIMHLRVSKPLYKPWLFLANNRKIKNAFIDGYFDNKNDFNKKRALTQENKAINNNIIYYKKTSNFFIIKYIRILLLKYYKFLNSLKYEKC